MSETAEQPAVRLWTLDGFRDDTWRHVEDADGLAATGDVILPLDAFLALDAEARRSANHRTGVRIKPGDKIEAIAEHLESLALVALEFPAFSDGRSFSKAELLRRRYGYKGAVRAVGQVLPDQFSHMLRVGFTEFEISHTVLLRWIEEGRVKGLGLYNQPSVRDDKPAGKYSWRRLPQ
ncbi:MULTISPECIES: DUF934 domain-containing protein [Mesorhizobium]|uniref:DUF934 domain-containing protein n=1 Tax=Mesorhizobium denitrificans TaxID=2294114 RepID=A0A371XJQ9_9HYPH|nr:MULTISPECIES: DUF934 domain-containing protein [Mesorhizobium]RFC69284.1 DUF934 domain-containing protein [Mesorhizobium denitrificans]